jgi:hypothetical protein
VFFSLQRTNDQAKYIAVTSTAVLLRRNSRFFLERFSDTLAIILVD